MTDVILSRPVLARGPGWRALAGELSLGFAYWAAFLLALEPGNLMRAAGGGHPLALETEAARILVASAIGAGTAPAVLAFTRRFPIEGPSWRGRAAIHVAGVAGLVLAMVPLSCLLACISIAERRLGGTDVAGQFADNGLLLAFCVAGFDGLAHALHFRRRDAGPPAAAAAPYLDRAPVKTRGGMLFLPLDEVDWIETQGNYLALHAGGATHLIRETSARMEARLDPERFVRVHRRMLVAIERVRELRPLGGGDAALTLEDGTRLRLSRSYRERVQARLQGARG